MILSKSNVVHYLLEQGLLAWESVVDGDVMVAEVTRRNRNFKVIRRAAQGYFVKQIRNWDPQAIAALAGEAACYRVARSGPEHAALGALVPRDFLYDAQRHVLVSELLADGETLSDYYRRLNAFPPEPARLLGGLFGRLHGDAAPLDAREAAMFHRQVPWILSAHQHGTSLFGAFSAANAQLLTIVQGYPDFERTLDELRQDWHAGSLMHGDFKWDNCVVYRDPSGNGAVALKVVDWELADIGDARWDLGALLSAYVSFWVLSMSASGELLPAQFAATAQYPMERMQPSVRAFWDAYVAARGLDPASASALLAQSVKFGAARMIQTAYEYMQNSAQIAPNALLLLQVSFNLLRDPQDAVTNLLGL
jgi:hypothetical protein